MGYGTPLYLEVRIIDQMLVDLHRHSSIHVHRSMCFESYRYLSVYIATHRCASMSNAPCYIFLCFDVRTDITVPYLLLPYTSMRCIDMCLNVFDVHVFIDVEDRFRGRCVERSSHMYDRNMLLTI